jgi:hypothetical protein
MIFRASDYLIRCRECLERTFGSLESEKQQDLNNIRRRIVSFEELRMKTLDFAVLSQIEWQLAQQQSLREQRRQEIYENQNEKTNEL